jgi:hypothetical protein
MTKLTTIPNNQHTKHLLTMTNKQRAQEKERQHQNKQQPAKKWMGFRKIVACLVFLV